MTYQTIWKTLLRFLSNCSELTSWADQRTVHSSCYMFPHLIVLLISCGPLAVTTRECYIPGLADPTPSSACPSGFWGLSHWSLFPGHVPSSLLLVFADVTPPAWSTLASPFISLIPSAHCLEKHFFFFAPPPKPHPRVL